MSDPVNKDKPKPPAAATDPAFKAAGPKAGGPKAPGAAPGKPGDAAGGEAKPDAFKVIRTAPAPQSDGPGVGPIVAVVVLVILGVGGFMYSRRAGTGTTTTKPGAGTTTGIQLPEAKPAPQFVIDAISDLETVSSAQRALDKALDYRKDYPGAPNLEAKITELRRKLGQGTGPSDVQARLTQANGALQTGRFDEALSLARGVIGDSQNQNELGMAYFISAQANVGKNDAAAAESDLKEAEDAGFNKDSIAQVRALLHR